MKIFISVLIGIGTFVLLVLFVNWLIHLIASAIPAGTIRGIAVVVMWIFSAGATLVFGGGLATLVGKLASIIMGED